MKIDPGFVTHWKTERLIDQLGGDGLIVLFRLWGQAQIKREWKGLNLNPKRLAMETKWKGDENHLFSILTDPDAPWLDKNEDGTFDIHGFEEHQKQVIHLWTSGGKGGRPKKKQDIITNNKEDTSSYSYSSSSSYPICEPNENQMVSSKIKKVKIINKPTLEEIEQYIATIPSIPKSEALAIYGKWQANDHTVNGKPIKNWQATIKNWNDRGFLDYQKSPFKHGLGRPIKESRPQRSTKEYFNRKED